MPNFNIAPDPLIQVVLPTLVGLSNGSTYMIRKDGTFTAALAGNLQTNPISGFPAGFFVSNINSPACNIFPVPFEAAGLRVAYGSGQAALTGIAGANINVIDMSNFMDVPSNFAPAWNSYAIALTGSNPGALNYYPFKPAPGVNTTAFAPMRWVSFSVSATTYPSSAGTPVQFQALFF